MRTLQVFGLLIIGVVFTMLGDVCFKHSNGIDRPKHLLLGMVLYIAGAAPIPFLFRSRGFGSVFVAWEAATVLLAMAIGHWYFGEKLTSAGLIAMLLAIGALLLQSR